jgi:hypothetical protein
MAVNDSRDHISFDPGCQYRYEARFLVHLRVLAKDRG